MSSSMPELRYLVVRSFLEKLGFVVGTEVTVISEIAGNMIVNVKGARVAIGKDMANKIMV